MDKRLSVLFVTKKKQKVFTGPNSHPRLKQCRQYVNELLQAVAPVKAINCRKNSGN